MPALGSTPSGASILMTSAPKSAKTRQQVGPARTRVKSRTFNPFNAGIMGLSNHHVVQGLRHSFHQHQQTSRQAEPNSQTPHHRAPSTHQAPFQTDMLHVV